MVSRYKNRKIQEAQLAMRYELLASLKLAQQELKDLEIFDKHPASCLALASVIGFIVSEKAL